MDVRIDPLDERGLADLLDAAVAGADPAEVLPAAAGATWDDGLRARFLAFHRGRALAPDPVERTWVVRADGDAVGALRLEPGPDGDEVGIWLVRDARGRGLGAAAVRQLLGPGQLAGPVGAAGTPLVARTTTANRAALGLLRALGAVTAPGTDGAVTARFPSDDHG
ncbi:Protein N-acetyltransferase, RimJ/RimL family [Pseudonocardia ammonioxydans]|uniref:Protein N-acetyltransferase, RimJ/RimL family n=1 Tax=Pseudonocardia ammonioxydans TaxID=260086 RepID=A0A1I5DPA1_PSUAM|nr:GNAT family N-acetyltransferase [Pseudonocardia ammonioxydans]SFO01053.1 Protein N-acetyltransferase, RimJ/RimL family [Pseudonocardia ammonioxydans]